MFGNIPEGSACDVHMALGDERFHLCLFPGETPEDTRLQVINGKGECNIRAAVPDAERSAFTAHSWFAGLLQLYRNAGATFPPYAPPTDPYDTPDTVIVA